MPAWLTTAEAEEGFARSYDTQFDEVYRSNPVGQRAVRLVAGMLGALTIDGDERAVALVHADGLLESITANLLLHGNAYVQLIADDRDLPPELCQLRPERVSVVSDERGWPVAYLYRAAGQRGPDRARRSARPAAARAYQGAAPARRPLWDGLPRGGDRRGERAQSRGRWNKALLDNAARPSGALSYEPADGSVLSADQFKRLKEELTSEFSGSGNAGRPLLLEGGLKWQAMSLTPADMDFVALKEGAARDIALAFGVPPVLVGLPGDATYANAREAGRALYRQTILPMAAQILNALAAMLGDWLGPVTAGGRHRPAERARRRPGETVGSGRGGEFLSDAEKRDMLGFRSLRSAAGDDKVSDERRGAAREPDGPGRGARGRPDHAARAGRGIEPGGGAAGAGLARAR